MSEGCKVDCVGSTTSELSGVDDGSSDITSELSIVSDCKIEEGCSSKLNVDCSNTVDDGSICSVETVSEVNVVASSSEGDTTSDVTRICDVSTSAEEDS